jgi:hypothetical protein
MAMFSGFNAYDDEGSFLITLRDYVSGQSLYTQIFSIYGPLYYETMAGLFKSIADMLKGRQRICVVKSQSVIDFWAEGRQVQNRPLVEFIDAGFVSAGAYGDYELLVRR